MRGYKFTPEDRQAIVETGARLGIDPGDLTAVMAYESRGLNPSIVGGAHNRYQGLIQLGPTERRQYGYQPGMTIADQVRGPVYNYLVDRGLKPGMGIAELYSIINAGSLTKDGQPRWSARDQNGTVREHVQRITQQYFGGADHPIPPLNVGQTAQGKQMPLGMGRGQIRSGPAVTQLQQQLAAAGLYTGKVDGSYGPKTAAAVRAAEATYNLTRDKGVAGPQVQAALAGTGKTQDITSALALTPPGGPAGPGASSQDIAFGRAQARMPWDPTGGSAVASTFPARPGLPAGMPGGQAVAFTPHSLGPYITGAPGRTGMPAPSSLASGDLHPPPLDVVPLPSAAPPTQTAAGGRKPFPNIVTDFPGYVKRSMEVAMPDAQSLPWALRGGIPGGPAVSPGAPPAPLAYLPPAVSPDPNQFGPDMAFLNRLAAPMDTSLPASVPGGPAVAAKNPLPRFFAGSGPGDPSPTRDLPRFDAIRFASEPNSGGMAPIPARDNGFDTPNFGTDLLGAILRAPGNAYDWATGGATPAVATPPAAPTYPSFAPDHFGAGLSARPYPSGESLPGQMSSIGGFGGSNFLTGSAGSDYLAGGLRKGDLTPSGVTPAGGPPAISSGVTTMPQGWAPAEGSMPFSGGASPIGYTPPAAPTPQPAAATKAAIVAGLNAAASGGGQRTGQASSGRGSPYFGQSPGAYSYAGQTQWGTPQYYTGSSYSNSPYTPGGYTAPNFSPGSGGPTYAYKSNGQGGGTYVDSHGNVQTY